MTTNDNFVDIISDEENDEGQYDEDDSEAEARNRILPFPLPAYISRPLSTNSINKHQRTLWQTFKLQTWRR
jgi:hypothetical protein